MSCLSVPVAEDGQPEHGRGSYVYGYGFDELVASMPSMAGKTIAVTGSTSGTGYVLAREAANKGARVLLLNRPSPRADAAEVRLTPTPKSAPPGGVFAAAVSSPKASAASDELKEETTAGSVEHVDCDLTSFASCEAAAASVLKRVGDAGLDVLCCNAAVMHLNDEVTADGFDVQMQTNHLGHHVLVCRLMPALAAAGALRGEARVVMHSSEAKHVDGMNGSLLHPPSWGARLQPEYFEKHAAGELGGEGWPVPGKIMFFHGPKQTRYFQSKLANYVYTCERNAACTGERRFPRALASRSDAEASARAPLSLPRALSTRAPLPRFALKDKLDAAGSKIKAMCCHPGVCKTRLIESGPQTNGYDIGETIAFEPMMMSVDDGAQAIIRASLEEDVQSGDFFGPARPCYPLRLFGPAEKLPIEEFLLAPEQKELVVVKSEEATGVKLEVQ